MPTGRTEAFYWGLLGVLVTVVCILLTRQITHVDRGAMHEIGVAFDAEPAAGAVGVTLDNLEQHRFEVPIVAVTDYDELLFIITPGTRTVTVYGAQPFEMSCAYAPDVQSAAGLATFVAMVRRDPLTSIVDRGQATPQPLGLSDSVLPLTPHSVWGVVLTIPPSLRARLQRTTFAQAVIRCSFAKAIVAAPTFSGRSTIVALPKANSGIVALDMSAFDGISDVRFGGGITTPNSGDQLRILDPKDRLTRIQWSDEAALEQRDIILVLIGGLAAIAAATFIEALRPAVKSRATPGDAPAP